MYITYLNFKHAQLIENWNLMYTRHKKSVAILNW